MNNLLKIAKRSAFRAISLLWISSLFGAGLAFLLQAIIARQLGPQSFGTLGSALATVTMVTPLVGLGIPQFWLKVFGEEGWRALRWVKGSVKLIFLNLFLVSTSLVLWALFGPHGNTMKSILLTLIIHAFGQSAIELVGGVLQLEEKYKALAIWQLFPHLARLILFVALVFFVNLNFNIHHASYVYSSVALVVFIIAIIRIFLLYKGKIDLKGHTDLPELSKPEEEPRSFMVFRECLPFGLGTVFHLIYFQSDLILLKYLAKTEEAGLYNVAFTVLVATLLLPNVIFQKFLVPKLHRWVIQDQERLRDVYRQGNIIMAILGSFIMLAVWLLSPWGVPLLFGSDYTSSVKILNILAISIPLLFLASNSGSILVTKENMKTKVFFMGCIAIINIVLNFILIPLYGAKGAATATVISNALLLALYFFAVRNITRV